MVKKKRQSDPGENGDESTESCDENFKSSCPHVAKAIDLARLKRTLKIGGFEKECAECKKSSKNDSSDPDFEIDTSLWMCLRCGSQLCGRAKNKHALNHFNTPHSDCHALTANTTTWDIYCYSCNNETTTSSSKKLHECIEYLKKQIMSGSHQKSLPPIELPPLEMYSKKDISLFKNSDKGTAPRVRGLSNLGNTCYFNSVMQCLVQTPYLLEVLQEMSTPGESFTLPGGKLKIKTETDEEKEVFLPPINGNLPEWGSLTRTLSETLAELRAGEGGVYVPRKLLSALITKHPQFEGGDQHDAQELLRNLLDAVRSEDLRRYQLVILSSLGLSSKTDSSTVNGELKQKVKFYGQQASDTILRPEQVFRGCLVSKLECQECFHQSNRVEYFLDLSLPVVTSRPLPPAVVRRKTQDDDISYSRNVQESKLWKRMVRKSDKKNGSPPSADDNATEMNGTVTTKDGKSSSEQSDADVEDNVEEIPRRLEESAAPSMDHTAANFAAYHMESGYNSEKVISSDSIRTSPADLYPEKLDVTPENTDKDKTEFGEYSERDGESADLKRFVSFICSNPDSGVASPETTKHNSTETVDNLVSSSQSKEMERPVSRNSYADEYGNRLESRGISLQGSRNVLERTGDNSYDSSPESNSLEGANLLDQKLNSLTLDMDDDNAESQAWNCGGEGKEAKGKRCKRRYRDPSDVHCVKKPNASSAPAPSPTKDNSEGDCQSKGAIPKRNDGDSKEIGGKRNAVKRYVCNEDECSVQSCLNQFTALELLTGNNKVGCDTCTERANGKNGKTVYTNATKRFLVSSPPAILILHLKRFQAGPRFMFGKISKHVDFPTVLDLAPFCAMEKVQKLPSVARGQSEILYSLYGVVEHSGGMHGGHYVAYVKVRQPIKPGDPRWAFLPKNDMTASLGSKDSSDSDTDLSGYESGDVSPPLVETSGKWYYISDSMVSEVSEDKVLRAQAYLLFYERLV